MPLLEEQLEYGVLDEIYLEHSGEAFEPLFGSVTIRPGDTVNLWRNGRDLGTASVAYGAISGARRGFVTTAHFGWGLRTFARQGDIVTRNGVQVGVIQQHTDTWLSFIDASFVTITNPNVVFDNRTGHFPISTIMPHIVVGTVVRSLATPAGHPSPISRLGSVTAIGLTEVISGVVEGGGSIVWTVTNAVRTNLGAVPGESGGLVYTDFVWNGQRVSDVVGIFVTSNVVSRASEITRIMGVTVAPQ